MPNVKVSQEDVLRYGGSPDPDFNEARNRKIIEESIKKNDKLRAEAQRKWDEGLQERSEMVYSYIRHLDSNKKDKSFTDYVGRDTVMALLGESKVQEIQRRALERGYSI